MKHGCWVGEVLSKTFPEVLCYYKEMFFWGINRSRFPRVMIVVIVLKSLRFRVPVPPEQTSSSACRRPVSPVLQEAIGA